jgi:phospholipid/cholesterol/gamma-HCH transport system substrate-binding protein
MNENRRNIMVGIFVAVGLAGLVWMIIRFGDLPAVLSRYDAKEVTLLFREAPGIQENSAVLFRGYPVGRVIAVRPPMMLADVEHPDKSYYQVAVVAAVGREFELPANVTPKVYRRGLGGSFLAFEVSDEQASRELLAEGAKLKGVVSEASEFISEGTQHKLDDLIGSLTQLSRDLQGQLTPLPPEVVDRSEANTVRPNVTTAVMRMDKALQNLNVIIGDVENQRNLKEGLANFSTLAKEMRVAVKETQSFAAEAVKLVDQTSQTVGAIDTAAREINANFQQVGGRIQAAADELAVALKHLDEIFVKISTGEGTAGRVLNDPRLYESLADAGANLNLAIREFRQLLAEWAKQGMKVKLK